MINQSLTTIEQRKRTFVQKYVFPNASITKDTIVLISGIWTKVRKVLEAQKKKASATTGEINTCAARMNKHQCPTLYDIGRYNECVLLQLHISLTMYSKN